MLKDGYHAVPRGKLAAVVTTLEMRQRADPRPEAAGADWQLRHVVRPEPGWYRELYRQVGEQWLWFSRLKLSADALAAVIGDPGVQVYALSAAGRDQGLLELDFRTAGECELAFFGLGPGLIGSGAGRWLMNRAIARAWAAPIGRFWVHTCTLDHAGALDFYCRSGFTPVSRQIEIADDPRADGVLPERAAPQIPRL